MYGKRKGAMSEVAESTIGAVILRHVGLTAGWSAKNKGTRINTGALSYAKKQKEKSYG